MARDFWGYQELFLPNRTKLFRALLAEFIGILMLNLFGCLSACASGGNPAVISLTFGLEVFAIITTLGHVSGSHINPAATLAFLLSGQITILRAICYVIVQCIGAVAGTAGLRVFLPESEHGELCHLYLHPDITITQGVFIEFILTFLLVLGILGVSDENKSESKYTAALTIGLIVVLANLSAINFTGAGMNPARYFGSAVVAWSWENHWVYWVGPLLGAIVATLIYQNLFKAPQIARR